MKALEPRAWWWVWYWSHDRYRVLKPRERVWWTCNEKTRAGDFAVLYVKRPTSALIGVIQAISDAEPDEYANEFTVHPWLCAGMVLSVFDQSILLSDLRADRWSNDEWPLIRANFQRSHGRPPRVRDKIVSRLARHAGEIRPYLSSRKLRRKAKAAR